MKLFVIGGAGFIGSHLVDRLLAEGHTVDVVDDLSSGTLANLAEARSMSDGTLKIHHLDATSEELSTLIGLRGADVVYHLALFPRNRPGAAAYGPGSTVGMSSALAVLEAAHRHGVGKVVVALPAAALYGIPAAASLPVKEGELVARGVRGVAAHAVVDLLAIYREQAGVDFTALALASVYGTRQRPDSGVVAAFLRDLDAGTAPTIDGDGRQTRDFVFIDDVVDALVRSAERSSGLLMNIGTGVQTSIRDLWTALVTAAGAESTAPTPTFGPPRRNEVPRFALAPARARIHLDWSPWTDLPAGLAQLLA